MSDRTALDQVAEDSLGHRVHRFWVEPNCSAGTRAHVQFPADAEAGADLDLFARTGTRATTLHFVVVENSRRKSHGASAKLVEFFLQRGVSSGLEDDEGEPVLHRVVRHCVEVKPSVALASRLPAIGEQIDATNWHTRTPLQLAVELGDPKLCEFLISNGADIEATSNVAKTPLQLSIERGDLEVSRLLVRELVRRNKRIEPLRVSLLHIAINRAARGQRPLKLVKMLCEAGADIEARDSSSRTPLHSALWANCEECAKLLIELGCSVNSKAQDGYTPLAIAVDLQLEESAKLLLARGADPRPDRRSPESRAIDAHLLAHNRMLSLDVIRLMLDCGAEECSTLDYDALLRTAVHYVDTERVKYLMDKGAGAGELADSLLVGVCLSTREVPMELVQLLLDQGADVGAVSHPGTALDVTVDTFYDYQPIACLLLNHLALRQSRGLDIGDRNRATLDEAEPEFKRHFESCLEELGRMQATTIAGTNATLYDLLVKEEGVVTSLSENESIVHAVYANRFAHFDWNLRYVLRKAQERSALVHQSRRFFDEFLVVRIPLELIGMIGRYLSDEDLRTVVRIHAWSKGTHALSNHRRGSTKI